MTMIIKRFEVLPSVDSKELFRETEIFLVPKSSEVARPPLRILNLFPVSDSPTHCHHSFFEVYPRTFFGQENESSNVLG